MNQPHLLYAMKMVVGFMPIRSRPCGGLDATGTFRLTLRWDAQFSQYIGDALAALVCIARGGVLGESGWGCSESRATTKRRFRFIAIGTRPWA